MEEFSIGQTKNEVCRQAMAQVGMSELRFHVDHNERLL